MTQIRIETELYPSPAQCAVLARQQEIADTVWQLLALQMQAHRRGQDVSLATLRHGAAHDAGVSGGPPVTRTVAQRRAEIRALARDVGWSRDVAVATLDDLVAEVSRRVRRGELPADRPGDHHLLLGPLARPLWPLQVELGGLETPVVAALYTLPTAARSAVCTWRTAFVGRVEREYAALDRGAGGGDAVVEAALLAHLARWGHVLGSPAADPALPCPVVRLDLREQSRLRLAPGPGGPRVWLVWSFAVQDVADPRRRGLVAGDPGIRNLWVTLDDTGSAVFPNPMTHRAWRSPPCPPPRGDLHRAWSSGLALAQRHAAVVTRQLHPVQRAAEVHLLDHEFLALEEPDLARFDQLRAEYGPWADWSGATVQHRYIAAVARLARRVVLIPARDAATSTCSTCRARGSMRYRRRAGRCRVCGAAHDRDVNAAANIYRLGRERL